MGRRSYGNCLFAEQDYPIVHLGSKHQKRCSSERSQRKKGIFVGYCEVSKAFRIYIPGHHHIEISRDVTFDEEAALKKSRRCQLEEVYEEEPVNPRTIESVREVPRATEPVREVIASPDEETPEDHDIK